MKSHHHLARALKEEAARLGFIACGIAEATRLDDEARRLEEWLAAGLHGTMHWMERHFDKRVDPTRLVDGARTVVSVLDSYYQDISHPASPTAGKISRYAWGDDYHNVVKEKLAQLYNWLGEHVDDLYGRVFVDSAPVLDKVWAQRAGLGWIGKHTNLINRSAGSFFFVGEMIVNVPLATDMPAADHCGTCTRCIDACPTDAIFKPYAVDANRCISYLTIEHREDDIPDALADLFGNWIFGCDICQDVCPWNKFARRTADERYMPRNGMLDTELERWVEIDLDEYRERFRNNPVKRAKYEGLRRNIRIALKTMQNEAEN